MESHYDKHYYFCDQYGGKKYKDKSGQLKEFGYAQGGLWNFQGILNKLIELLGKPKSILDIGAGCGGFVANCNANGIEALGLEFSQYAIDHSFFARQYLKQWDLSETPWPVDKQYDWVTAIDLFEHVFQDDVDIIIKETKRVAKRFIIAKICTAQNPNEVWTAKKDIHKKVIAQAKREGFEWLVVSGHVLSKFPQHWIDKFVDEEWENCEKPSQKLKADLKLPEDWRTTLILRRKS